MIRIGRESKCLPYAGFFFLYMELVWCEKKSLIIIKTFWNTLPKDIIRKVSYILNQEKENKEFTQ